MSSENIRIALPFFIALFSIVVYVWGRIRKGKQPVTREHIKARISPDIRIVNNSFKLLLAGSFGLSLLYAFLPEYYHFVGQMEFLDYKIINSAGMLLLIVSFVWIVFAQLRTERAMTLITAGINGRRSQKVIDNSQRLILTGVFIMFLGLFITISSAVSILICLFALAQFARLHGYA